MEPYTLAHCDVISLLERLGTEIADLIYFDPPTRVSREYNVHQLRTLYLHATCHAKRILKKDGVLVWHVLPERAADVRNCLDRVFGPDLFASEIVLKRPRLNVKPGPIANHTSLVIYSKSKDFFYAPPTRELSDLKKAYSESDARGPFRLGDLTAPFNRPNLQYEWNNYLPPAGRSWRFTKEKLDELHAAGQIVLTSGRPRIKVYLNEHPTEEIGSIWDDIALSPIEVREKYYESQQSLLLLSRIIKMLTKEGYLVVDPFCGSATSLIAAHDAQRNWIGCDYSSEALAQAFKRVKKVESLCCKALSADELLCLPVQSSLTELIRELPKAIEPEHVDIHQLIISNESKTLEFKETLSFDVKKNTKEKYIEEACLKTIAGFLNADGGTLLVGVTDDNRAVGVDVEITSLHKGSRDKFLLHLKNVIKENIGEVFYPFIKSALVTVDGKTILRIDCKEGNSPCFIGDDFYVRTNPATDKLAGPKLIQYISVRFHGQFS